MPAFRSIPLCLLVALPGAAFQAAPPLEPQAVPVPPELIPGQDPDQELVRALLRRRPELGLAESHGFRILDVQVGAAGDRHVRLQQSYRGLRVWGGQAILHLDPQGRQTPMTDALVRSIQVPVEPNLSASEALAVANASDAPRGAYARPPTVELLIYPEARLQRAGGFPAGEDAMAFAPRILRNHLAYHIHLELENGAPETRHDDYLVDAHTGALLKRWSTLLTFRTPGTPVLTTGHSQYSGDVQLGSLSTQWGYILSDPTRQDISTRDLRGGTDGGVLYISQDGQWGDGQNYGPAQGTGSRNGQTAAVDAHFGLQSTWDFYRNILKRNGIDGKGTPVRNLVHYASGFDNAFWADECFCMTYGDGSMFKTLTAPDVVGHEVSHGLCHATADLDYDGESGGLNEANSDIFGVMIQLYIRSALGESSLPAQGARWTIGADLTTEAFPQPLRYLYKPSLDGFSPDAWSPELDGMDVHFSSGPMNRAFYFLSAGASARPKDDTHSPYLPKGMTGIGNDKALRIWWRTLSTYLTPRSRYRDARLGALRAAGDIYGPRSAEARAVDLAFQGINVGIPNATVRSR
jgi:Zn-dependent metalloprotease